VTILIDGQNRRGSHDLATTCDHLFGEAVGEFSGVAGLVCRAIDCPCYLSLRFRERRFESQHFVGVEDLDQLAIAFQQAHVLNPKLKGPLPGLLLARRTVSSGACCTIHEFKRWLAMTLRGG
jgi:hypothetical protein